MGVSRVSRDFLVKESFQQNISRCGNAIKSFNIAIRNFVISVTNIISFQRN